VTLHPSLDLLPIYFVASHLEHQLALVSLDELSFLTLPNNRLHFLGFDVLIFAPSGDARSVLSKPAEASGSAPRRKGALPWLDDGDILSFEATLIFHYLLHLR
jgi:hypothetical protein